LLRAMDGLSALSVAASVAQFLEFGCSLVSKSKEIYRSAEGASSQKIEVESATKRLVDLSAKIREGAEDQALQTVCDGCISVSQTLLAKLEKLKVQDGQSLRKYKSFRQALKSVWSKGSLDDVAKRLKAYQEEMDAHVLVSLR
jgi:uncharacterized protein with PIN domain